MDFSALPPEINSGLLYSGPGPQPLTGAARAWSTLSTELSHMGAAHTSATTALMASWNGPSAWAANTGLSQFADWLTQAATTAERSAAAATMAASAYSTAKAAAVAPPVIAANRTQLAHLVATNLLGQNTPAIAANEAAYMAMWAQDAAAMNSYSAASSAAVAQLPQPGAATSTASPLSGVDSIITAVEADPLGALILNTVESALGGSYPVVIGQLGVELLGLLPLTAIAGSTSNMATSFAEGSHLAPTAIAQGASVRAILGAASSSGGPSLSAPPSWARPHGYGDMPENMPKAAAPLTVEGQTAIPAVPFMPVAGMRSNAAKVRAQPEYGPVSKVLGPRNPAAG